MLAEAVRLFHSTPLALNLNETTDCRVSWTQSRRSVRPCNCAASVTFAKPARAYLCLKRTHPYERSCREYYNAVSSVFKHAAFRINDTDDIRVYSLMPRRVSCSLRVPSSVSDTCVARTQQKSQPHVLRLVCFKLWKRAAQVLLQSSASPSVFNRCVFLQRQGPRPPQ